MRYPTQLTARLTRDGKLITISRYGVTGYYEITKETSDANGAYFHRVLFDTARDAWRYYRHNRIGAN